MNTSKGFAFLVSLATVLVVISGSLSKALAESDQPLGFEFSLSPGATEGPFGTDTGFYINGALDVPIFKSDPLLGQKFMGEILVGYSKTKANVTSVSPLALLNPALTPALTSTKLDITILQVVLGGKYKLDKLGEPESFLRRVQPFVTVGLGFNVVLSKTRGSPLGDFVGGIGPLPAELQRLGVPPGQGDVRVGVNVGGGVDYLITKNIFVGGEIRYQSDGPNGDFPTYSGRVGFLF